MNDDICESTLISSIQTSEDLAILLRAEVTDEDFGNIVRPAFQWFMQHVRGFNKMPPIPLLASTFPDIPFNPIKGSVEQLSQEVKQRSTKRKIKEVLGESIGKIDSDPYASIDSIVSKLAALKPKNTLSLSLTDKSALERYDAYTHRKDAAMRADDMKTGFGFFDDRKAYWAKGEFSGFVARPFVGKSWSLIYTAACAYFQKKKVLFVSPELGIEEAERRFDVVLASMFGNPIVLSDIRYGNDSSKENYRLYTEKLSQRSDLVVIDSIQGRKVSPSRLNDLCGRFSPDMLCIDGVGFIADDGGSSSGWERVYNVCTDLKLLSITRNMTTLTVQQVKPQVPGHRVPTLEDIAYGDGFVQTVDRLITMSFNEDSSNFRDYTVQKDRVSGAPLLDRQKTQFEPEIGKFGLTVGNMGRPTI